MACYPRSPSTPPPPNQATVTISDDDQHEPVRIVATDPHASEADRDPGRFKLSAAIGPDGQRSVPFALGGTATIGLDYEILLDGVTIHWPRAGQAGAADTQPDNGQQPQIRPNGLFIMQQEKAAIEIVPRPDDQMEGTESVTFTLLTDDWTRQTGEHSQATVFIAERQVGGHHQIVEGPQAVTTRPGGTLRFGVHYSSSNQDNTLTGLGLRLHFDSSTLDLSDLNEVLEAGFISQQAQDDLLDLDGDPATDTYVHLLWADPAGQWPNRTLPATLFTASVVGLDLEEAPTRLNFSSGDTGGFDWTLDAASVLIRLQAD